MPRFLINNSDIKNDTVYINGTEYNYIVKVLRHKNGDRLTLFDGESLEYQGTIKNILPYKLKIQIISSYTPDTESYLNITLIQVLPKGNKMDLIVEEATEL